MQTIKTAAIVVLMLTVLYGGYVSLTTPPEPLPDEIEDILIIEESAVAAFDPGDDSPGELASHDLKLSEPPAGVLAPLAPAAGEMQPAPQSPGTFGSSFADLGSKKSDADASTGGTKKLPAVGPATAPITPGPADSYASTPDQFHLPDPTTVPSNFEPSDGASVESSQDVGFKLTDQNASTATQAIAPETENKGLTNAFKTADAMYGKGQLKEALATLSVFYGMPNISESQRGQLLARLDPLAREVIYSRRHLLEQPHRVTGSETLVGIAGQYEVPWQLLANINNVDDPVTVLPGTELKIIRGPFRAEVDLTKKQLTLFLGDLYAGRFDIEVGSDPPPTTGVFTVQEKQTEHVYYDRSGIPVPAGSPDNPYGNMWLDLGGQICIHGSPNTVQPTTAGCISVAGDYADDVYGILSQGSSVTIRR